MIGSIHVVEADNCAEAHHKAVESVLYRLRRNCEEERQILLLISGGSNLSVAVQALSQLTALELAYVHVAQVDERFVPRGDQDSNWQQFVQTFGSIEMLAGVTPVLEEGVSFFETVNNYDLELTNKIKEADYSLALVGIGPDGHMAGMKPLPAIDFQLFFNDDFVAGYKADDFKRITVTDYGLKVLSDIVVFACDEAKKDTIRKLAEHIPVHKQPAQLLKVYDRVTLFTDKL